MNITNDKVTEYLQEFYEPVTPKLGELRKEAEENKVPIILKETETFLKAFISIIKPERILEIGCAVGYSAMFMAEVTNATIDTIEKDPDVYKIAINNVNKLGYSDRITVHEGDGAEALNSFLSEVSPKYDLVFIDAAKSHYKRFLDATLPYTHKDTIFISDNVLFKARVASDEYDPTGKYKTNVKRLREFNEYIMNDERFTSTIIAVGDGLAITRFNYEKD